MEIRAIGTPAERKIGADGQPIIPLDDKGQPKPPWINVVFYHVPNQTQESVSQGRAQCVAFQQGLATPTAAPQVPAPVTVAPAPVPVATPAPQPMPVAQTIPQPTQVIPPLPQAVAPQQVAPVASPAPAPGLPQGFPPGRGFPGQ
jgi:hypothetical protein